MTKENFTTGKDGFTNTVFIIKKFLRMPINNEEVFSTCGYSTTPSGNGRLDWKI